MERDRMVGYSNIITKEAFVAPTPSSNHSMLHQTFTHPLLSTLLPPRPPQVKNAMEPPRAPEKTSPEPEFVLPSEVAWPWGVTDQPGSALSEHFSVDDLLDFDGLENEDEVDNTNCGLGVAAATAFEAPPLPPPPSDINLPTHDAEEFEWMSSIIDDSIPTYPPCTAAVPRFTPAPLAPVVVKAKRSKRSRRQSWPANPSFSDSSTSSTATFSSVSSSSSHPGHFMLKYADYELEDIFHEPKKRGRKAHRPAAPQAVWEKRCTHCGSQQTPQWRAGPEGPKTLCNACGVRYKSGRLVPEYRPTASPTFVPEVHSASHRKVLMMRQRKEEQHRLAATAGAPPVASF